MALSCDGNLTQNPDGTVSCDGLWEVVVPDIERLSAVLEVAFSTPTSLEIQQSFMAGFTLPAICYLVAYCYGLVINWFNVAPDDEIE